MKKKPILVVHLGTVSMMAIAHELAKHAFSVDDVHIIDAADPNTAIDALKTLDPDRHVDIDFNSIPIQPRPILNEDMLRIHLMRAKVKQSRFSNQPGVIPDKFRSTWRNR